MSFWPTDGSIAIFIYLKYYGTIPGNNAVLVIGFMHIIPIKNSMLVLNFRDSRRINSENKVFVFTQIEIVK